MGVLFDEVRRRVTAEDAARAYGLLRSDWQRKALCPWHADSNPSLSFNRRTGRCKCFACNQGGSSIDLTAQLFGLSPLDAARKLNEDFKLDVDETGHVLNTGESKAEKRKQYNEFIRFHNDAACKTLREAERMLMKLDGLRDEDAYREWVLIRDNALARLDWIEHFAFDEWRQLDANGRIWL